MYRPPDQTNFLYHFESVLGNIRSDAEMIMLGDFNINFKDKNNGLLKKYAEVLNMFGLKQLINSPTRVTRKSSTIIDHVLCNTSNKICNYGTIVVGLSDHFLFFCTRKVTRGQINEHNTVEIRCMKNYSIDTFVDKLCNADWSSVLQCSGCK